MPDYSNFGVPRDPGLIGQSCVKLLQHGNLGCFNIVGFCEPPAPTEMSSKWLFRGQGIRELHDCLAAECQMAFREISIA